VSRDVKFFEGINTQASEWEDFYPKFEKGFLKVNDSTDSKDEQIDVELTDCQEDVEAEDLELVP